MVKHHKKQRVKKQDASEHLVQSPDISDFINRVYTMTSDAVPIDICRELDVNQDVLRNKALRVQQSLQQLHTAIDIARDFTTSSSLQDQTGNESARISDVLHHAHRSSYTAGAPSGYVPGQSLLYMMKPPAPQTVHFQNSILHTVFRKHEKPLYLERKTTHDTQEQVRVDDTMVRSQTPSELLKQLPPMPKEWKPGDPIPGIGRDKQNIEADSIRNDRKPATFAFSLNPDMDVEFDVAESSDDESDDSDDY